MQSQRFATFLTALALYLASACVRQTPRDRLVGIWQFTGMDATMDYVFKADLTYEVWAEPMDTTLSKGPWLQMDFGSWKIEGDEIIIESHRPLPEWLKEMAPDTIDRSEVLKRAVQRVDRLKVSRFGTDKIEFQKGGAFIRATSRRGV